VALGKPCDRERRAWYFQRYVEHLPVAEEFVLFNRSWYNRAGVEHVMGFCTKQEHEEFMNSVPKFEEMLIDSGISILKYYLDIDKDEQVKRLAERQRDPLKHWKSSPIDAVAVKHWKAYSATRDAMLLRTHARFEIADVEGLRPHYALTLRHWVARLERHHAEALQYVSESTWRVWRLYMAACALEFESGEIGVCQILASKRSLGSASIPLTRQHLYPASHRSRTAVICY
jgi:hypothetical protein